MSQFNLFFVNYHPRQGDSFLPYYLTSNFQWQILLKGCFDWWKLRLSFPPKIAVVIAYCKSLNRRTPRRGRFSSNWFYLFKSTTLPECC